MLCVCLCVFACVRACVRECGVPLLGVQKGGGGGGRGGGGFVAMDVVSVAEEAD
jgi:hypothetical protein